LKERKRRIEDGGGQDDREKYEILNGGDDDEDWGDDDEEEEAFFYIETKAPIPEFEDDSRKVDGDKEDKSKKTNVFEQQRIKNKPVTPGLLTAPPPPPDVAPDENGERVVTVYNTADQNDLTGVAAAQPGLGAAYDPMTGPVAEPDNTPWDFENNQNNPNGNQKSEASIAEMEAAKEEITELVQSLLAMTGAPGFVHNDGTDDDENNVLSSVGIFRQQGKAPSSS
jgi:hypothetical protein